MYFTYWDDLGTTPARVNRFTGEIQINNRYFDNMPEAFQKFIIEHEKGHFLTHTRSELKADQYAFNKLAGSAPRSLKNSVFSISRVLSFRNPDHRERLIAMIKLALEYDYNNNGNTTAKSALDQLNEMLDSQKFNSLYMEKDNSYFDAKFGDSEFNDLYDNAGGRAKRQANRATRKAKHVVKKTTRVAKHQAHKATRVANRIAHKGIVPAGVYATGIDVVNAFPSDNSMDDQANMYDAQPEPIDNSYPEPQDEFIDDVDAQDDDQGDDIPEDEDSFDNGAGKDRRNAKKDAEQKKRDLKNDRLDSKNKLRLSKGAAKETKADAKKALADKGINTGFDWNGAVNGVLGIFGGGKGKAKDGTDIAVDPSALPVDDAPKKLLGMPKGVAIAVIIVVVLLIGGVAVYFTMKKKK